MGDTGDSRIEVAPFDSRRDYERMVDYFLNADESFLEGMGVDPNKLPEREAWIESALRDHERPDSEKDRSYLKWICDGATVGHSSINRIKLGEQALIHLHLWVRDLRSAGLGTKFFRASAAEFIRMYRLKRLYCEPYAENTAPNRVLEKCGFRFIKKYRIVPGPINFEQDVNQYVFESLCTGAG
jgi:RimJ/RimL family protein N-acetyltransferase